MGENELVREVNDEIRHLQRIIGLINRDESSILNEKTRKTACQLTTRHMHSEEYVQDLLKRLAEKGNNELANQLRKDYAMAETKVKPYLLVPSE